MNIPEVQEEFHTELDAVKYFERIRWGQEPQCPYCGSKRLSGYMNDLRIKCYDCHVTSSVTIGTYLHGTNVNLGQWLWVFSLISNAEKGITAGQIKRELDCSYLTAWKIYYTARDLMDLEYREGSIIADITESTTIGKLRNRLKRYQSTIERCIRIKSKKVSILSMSKPKENLKFSKIMGYIAKRTEIFFLIQGVDNDLIESFWAMVERQIRARYEIINLKKLREYILEAVFVIRARKDISMFHTLLNNSMKEKEYVKRNRNDDWL